MHDRRARRVPAFGEQHRVDEHVDLAALVRRERLGELHGRRAPADRLGLQAGGAELLREVVRVVDAGRVDDAGQRVEAVAVERRGGLVQRLVVEDLRQLALVEVAADDRHGVDRGGGRHAQVAQRRDQPAPRGVARAAGRRPTPGRRPRPASRSAARSRSCRCRSARGNERIAALVFSPSAVCASSQITSWYASRESEPTWRANHAYVWIVIGLPRSGSVPVGRSRA